MAFVHLHVHTQYSLLQGTISVEGLLQRVQTLGMSAVAMTDTHNLFGAMDFYLSARKLGIQPILGCEIFYQSTGFEIQRHHHLVLLCKNFKGYQNLCQLLTRSYARHSVTKGNFLRPVVDRALLAEFAEGLIVLSGCLKSELSYLILQGEEQQALQWVQWFQGRFGEDFFLELQDSLIPEQQQVNDWLSHYGQKQGIACVATSDCHYLDPESAAAHEVLQCIEQGRHLNWDRPKSLVPSDYDLKSEAVMRERFGRFPEACDQTCQIAAQCQVDFQLKDDQGRPIYHLPPFYPEGVKQDAAFDLPEYFRLQARQGLKQRFEQGVFRQRCQSDQWPVLQQQYEKRLEDELAMILQTGFAGYFLIVADFINWAKQKGIPVGPGRGSGAGSLVAYALKITDIDPIQFHLLFERFINPERISMPDFDVDFCQERRSEVIDYVAKRYGSDHVCQIITLGKLQARAVIRDVGRVLGLSFTETDQLTKLLPDELDLTLQRALELEPRLTQRMEAEPLIAQVMQYAQSLEGLYRNAGVHAAGVIITEKPVVDYCPLLKVKDGTWVTQFDKDFAEAIGLVKFDFLGLKTLTVIDYAIQLIRQVAEPQSADVTFDLERMMQEMDDRVFALISSGDTDGVFQVESAGMKDLCMRIQPQSLEDITAINALYRPGPLGSGMVDDFIDRKHGRKAITYEVETLEPILKETYGVILYQEQVMRIARELAGYSLGQADLLRRAMGKKKPEEMAQHREIFIQGALQKGLKKHQAESIFDLMAKFAEYGFNKSHSAAYGVLTYQTAYLKTHYPTEFMAALMTTEMDNTDKITKYIRDARRHRLPILPPDVNVSQKKFSVERVALELGSETKGIRFGLEAIKGVGSMAVDAILQARKKLPFQSVLDLCQRVPTRKLNKKVLESLCLAGALDTVTKQNRASLFASLETLLSHASEEQAERELGQSSLFDQLNSDEIQAFQPQEALFKNEVDWPMSLKLAREKEVVGFFVSGHPMQDWQDLCESWLGWSTEKIQTLALEKKKNQSNKMTQEPDERFAPGRFRVPKQEVKLAGLMTECKEITTKKGHKMAFGQLEDLKGQLELVIFPEAYALLQECLKTVLQEAQPVILTGEVEWTEEVPKVFVKTLDRLSQVHEQRVKEVMIQLSPSETSSEQLRALKKQLLENRGTCLVRLSFLDENFQAHLVLPKIFSIQANPATLQGINQIFGKNVVILPT